MSVFETVFLAFCFHLSKTQLCLHIQRFLVITYRVFDGLLLRWTNVFSAQKKSLLKVALKILTPTPELTNN